MAEKTINGYATTYLSHTYDSSLTGFDNMFDWDKAVPVTSTASGKWPITYMSFVPAYSKSVLGHYYCKGISGWKSALDSNLDDKYDGTGSVFTNFNCVPTDTELLQVKFRCMSSMRRQVYEHVRFSKNNVLLTDYLLYKYNGTSDISNKTTTLYTSKSSDAADRIFNGDTGITFKKHTDGNFYRIDKDGNFYTNMSLGRLSAEDLQNGALTAELTHYYDTSMGGGNYGPKVYFMRLEATFDIISDSKIYIGNQNATGLYLGNTQAQAYIGTTRII